MRWFAVAIVLMACSGEDKPPVSPAPATPEPVTSDAGTTKTETPAADAAAPPPANTTEEDTPSPPAEEHDGEATYYAAGTTGACGIKTPSDKLVGALGPSFYSKAVCGQCAEVSGPKGTVTVLINDRCAGCKGASMDLSTQAFTQIASKSQGRVQISWHYVDCP